MSETTKWFYCLEHDRPEPEERMCRAASRLGPYDSEADARRWKETAEARNEKWEEEDQRWES